MMANTQVSISKNGKATLATAGMVCDRNIDVNVNVPVPSGSKTITENGTHDVTNYASAVVDVAGKPTQFVNVLEYADSLEVNKRISANGSYNTTNTNSCIVVTLNLNKLPGGNPLKNNANDIRFRGCIRIDTSFAVSSDGVTYSAKSFTAAYQRIDEYGDLVYNRGYTNGPYVRFNIGLVPSFSSGNAALPSDFDPVAAGCIVTFDQPIGNGGYVG